jgi:hypothetical protein
VPARDGRGLLRRPAHSLKAWDLSVPFGAHVGCGIVRPAKAYRWGEEMKRFLVLVPLVAVGILILGLTAAGPATAGSSHGAGTHRVPVHVLNLHKAYEARLGHITQGSPTGIAYPLGKKPISGRGGNDCPEPYCPVQYHGGPVQHHPHVYLLLWGPNWSSDPNQAQSAIYLEHFFSGLGVQPQDAWSTVTSQYGDGSGTPTFSGSVFGGVFHDTSTPPSGVGSTGLAAEADAFASTQGITDLTDAQIVVATQSGTCPSGFYAPTCAGGSGYYCAWHDFSNEPYINLPYIPDAGSACGEDFVNSNGTDDGFSIVGGHEYAETITDPHLGTGWADPSDLSGGEIGDKCAWSTQSGDVVLSTGSFAMQPLWSNSVYSSTSGNACVMSHVVSGDITLQSPGNQSNYQRSRLSLLVIGTSSGGYPLTWQATGLPAGMTIDPSGGMISGQVNAPPGAYSVTITASDQTPAQASVSFTWTVLADVGTTVANQATGKCLNDNGYKIAPDSEVVRWTCNTAANEKWSHPTNMGELIVLGQCLTDPNHGGPGALMVIDPCAGASNQEWFHNSKHEYVLKKNSLCLTDPNPGTVNGDPLFVSKCTDATDQRWTGS